MESKNFDDNLIEQILKKNALDDLKQAIETRKTLNKVNTYLLYAYHFFQTMGIILNAAAINSENQKYLSYIGIGCNAFATLINTVEKNNVNLSEKLLTDIKNIKEGNYIDEETIKEDTKDAL